MDVIFRHKPFSPIFTNNPGSIFSNPGFITDFERMQLCSLALNAEIANKKKKSYKMILHYKILAFPRSIGYPYGKRKIRNRE